MTITGGCRCGAVRYSIETEAITARHCWCRDCQYIGAGSGTVNVFFSSDAVKVEGELSDYTNHAASGNLMHRQFCPKCGTPMFTQSDERSRERKTTDDYLDFKRTKLGRLRPKHPAG